MGRKRARPGVCCDCSATPEPGKNRCTSCRERNNLAQRNRRQRKAVAGLCLVCGKEREPDTTSRTHCKACLAEHVAYCGVQYHMAKSRCHAAYGSACACCGETTPQFLSIDHIHNDGAEHRRELSGKNRGGGCGIYRWLEKRGYPKDRFQLLCHNCNFGKRLNNGVCPHQRLKIVEPTNG